MFRRLPLFLLFFFLYQSNSHPSVKTVSDVIDEKNCSTIGIKSLSQQLTEVLLASYPDIISQMEPSSQLILRPEVLVVPLLQKPAYQALLSALATTNQTMTVTSSFRVVPQQTLLYNWYLMGLCGITLAYKPGNSSHESGLAIDIREHEKWIDILAKFDWQWMGSSDVVHFTYIGKEAQPQYRLNVLGFQKLWNCNNPDDLIEETGVYDEETDRRVLNSPADGFKKACTEFDRNSFKLY